jgi:hypothetical protein
MQLTLSQASIFAAILTAFIIESKKLLEQDSTDVIANVLIFYTNNMANGTHKPYTPPIFEPSTLQVTVNCLLFASLSLSLVTALAGVLALQWVSKYDVLTKRMGASPQDRASRRHYRFIGTLSWTMDEVISALPIILNFAVILFFSGIIVWMWELRRSVSVIILAGATVAIAFYVITASLAVWFPSSPFRTPLSEWMYYTCHTFILLVWKLLAPDGINEKSMDNHPTESGQSFITKACQHLQQHFSQSNLENRDDRYIMENAGLRLDSLAWLVKYITISDVSYLRLRLLVRELSRFTSEQLASGPIRYIPWETIFGVIGKRFAQNAQDRGLGAPDIPDLVAMLECFQKLGINSSIPTSSSEPVSAPVHQESSNELSVGELRKPSEIYGNIQHTIIRNIRTSKAPLIYKLHHWAYSEHSDRPNDVESLAKRRIAYLNVARMVTKSPTKLLEVWSNITTLEQEEQICDYLIGEILPTLGSWGFEETQVQIDNLVCLLRLRRPLLLEEPIEIIDNPIPIFTRNKFIIQYPSPTIHRLRCANWMQQSLDHPQIHAILKSLLQAHRVYPKLQLRWRFVASQEEELSALLLVDATDKGRLANTLAEHKQGLHLVQHLKPLDDLITNLRADNPSDKRQKIETITELACRDFCMQDFPGPAKIPPPPNGNGLYIEDWSLRLISYIASHRPHSLHGARRRSGDEKSDCLSFHVSEYCCGDHISINTSTIWQLRVMLWREFDPKVTESLMQSALMHLPELVRICLFPHSRMDSDLWIQQPDMFCQKVQTTVCGHRVRFRLSPRCHSCTPCLWVVSRFSSFMVQGIARKLDP